MSGIPDVPAKFKELCNKFISLLHDDNIVVQRQAFVSLYNVFPHIEGKIKNIHCVFIFQDKTSLTKLVLENIPGFMKSIGEYHETSGFQCRVSVC